MNRDHVGPAPRIGGTPNRSNSLGSVWAIVGSNVGENDLERLIGRKPQPDDLIVPSRRGKHRNANHMLRRFHEDLARLGLRARRQHDARRTFISLARADGARPDILRWATHGPTGDITDVYTTLPWSTLCDEVSKLKIALREGKLIALPFAANGRTAASW